MNFLLISYNLLLEKPALRWAASFTLVIAVYVGILLLVLNWNQQNPHAPSQPMAAMIVDLAPLPSAPEIPPNTAPSGPQQNETLPPPLEPEPEPDPAPVLPIVKKAEAILPSKPQPIKEEPEPIEETLQEQEEKAPPSIDVSADDITAAPMEGTSSITPSQAPASWQSILLRHLEHHKRYPREARRNRQEAIVYVRVKINRDGTVINYQLEKNCPYEPLNQATLALIARAQPLPPPPETITGETIEFVVPVEYFLAGR